MAAAKTLKTGDKVTWDSSQGKITGKVVKKLTATAKVKGHVAKATKDHPEYKVKSDKTGAEAIHKPEGLHKA